jgi:hypothetical protein
MKAFGYIREHSSDRKLAMNMWTVEVMDSILIYENSRELSICEWKKKIKYYTSE